MLHDAYFEAGVFEGKRFGRRTFVRHLKTRADRIEREKKRKDDDDDDDD